MNAHSGPLETDIPTSWRGAQGEVNSPREDQELKDEFVRLCLSATWWL